MIENQKNSDGFIDACSDSELLYSFDICSRTTRSKSISCMRATGHFDMEVSGNSTVKANTEFPLEIGETVAINAVYSPQTASVDFGLLAPDGLFYALNTTDGSFDEVIEVDQRGNYTLVVRNNSDYSINVSGYVNY